VDPVSNLAVARNEAEIKPTLMRLIDFLKHEEITTVFTSLTSGDTPGSENSEVGVSSLMDVWLLLRNVEFNGERNRTLYVLKARGVAHSNQVREFVLGEKGVDLLDVYLGSDRVLTGTARVTQEAREQAETELRQQDHDRKVRQLAARRKALDAQIAALQAEAEAETAEVNFSIAQETWKEKMVAETTRAMAHLRSGRRLENSRLKH